MEVTKSQREVKVLQGIKMTRRQRAPLCIGRKGSGVERKQETCDPTERNCG